MGTPRPTWVLFMTRSHRPLTAVSSRIMNHEPKSRQTGFINKTMTSSVASPVTQCESNGTPLGCGRAGGGRLNVQLTNTQTWFDAIASTRGRISKGKFPALCGNDATRTRSKDLFLWKCSITVYTQNNTTLQYTFFLCNSCCCNSAAWVLTKTQKRAHMTKSINWWPVHFHSDFKNPFISLQSTTWPRTWTPGRDAFCFRTREAPLRSSGCSLLAVPQRRTKPFGDAAFSH